MESLLTKEITTPDWKEDMQRGLSIISARTEALNGSWKHTLVSRGSRSLN